ALAPAVVAGHGAMHARAWRPADGVFGQAAAGIAQRLGKRGERIGEAVHQTRPCVGSRGFGATSEPVRICCANHRASASWLILYQAPGRMVSMPICRGMKQVLAFCRAATRLSRAGGARRMA